MKVYRTRQNFKEFNLEYNIQPYGEMYDPEEQPSLTDPSQGVEAKDIIRNFTRDGMTRVLRQQTVALERGRKGYPTEMDYIEDRLSEVPLMDAHDKFELAQKMKNLKESQVDRLANRKFEEHKAAQAKKAAESPINEAPKGKTPEG